MSGAKPARKHSASALRQARLRERQAAAGITQLNIRAHQTYHATIRDLARRSVNGEALEAALLEIAPEPPVRPPEPRSTPEQGGSTTALYSAGWRPALARWLLGISRPIEDTTTPAD